jgi:hypothetical protein
MKKPLLILVFALFFSACAEKDQYEQAVFQQVSNDPDIKDYNIDPEAMTTCIVNLSSKKMPGILPIEPKRKKYYLGLAKMISARESSNPKQTLEEGRAHFDSPKIAMQAMMNHSESSGNCMAALTVQTEPEK